MTVDQELLRYPPTKFSSPRAARAAASRDEDTRRVVDRLLQSSATAPARARALQQLSPGEQLALEELRRGGLAIEVARDLWWLHPMAWDDRLDNAFREQMWLFALVAVVSILLVWLQYFVP